MTPKSFMAAGLCLLALLSLPAFAQNADSSRSGPALTPQDAIAAIAPVVKTDDLPSRIIIAGAGITNGKPSGFTNLLIHAAGPIYAAVAEDVTAGRTSTRVGIETIIFRTSNLFITAKGNAGAATSSTAVGGSYGVGGSVGYQLTKLKLPGYIAVFSGTWDYSNISDLAVAVSGGQIKPVLSGGTYRFGIGRSF